MLQSREAHLQELFEAARGRLEELSKDQSKYQELLTKLVLQVSRRLAARAGAGRKSWARETA